MSDENATPATTPAPEPAPEPDTPATLADTHVGTPILALEEQAAESEPIAEGPAAPQPEPVAEPPTPPESVEPAAVAEEATTPLETEVLAEPVKKKRTKKVAEA